MWRHHLRVLLQSQTIRHVTQCGSHYVLNQSPWSWTWVLATPRVSQDPRQNSMAFSWALIKWLLTKVWAWVEGKIWGMMPSLWAGTDGVPWPSTFWRVRTVGAGDSCGCQWGWREYWDQVGRSQGRNKPLLLLVLWFPQSGSHQMKPIGCRGHRSAVQCSPQNPASWPRSGQRSLEPGWGGRAWRMPTQSPHITLLLHSAQVLGFPSGSSPPVLMLSVSLLSSISSLSAHCLCHPIVWLAPKASSICPLWRLPPACTASLPHPAGSELFSPTVTLTCGGPACCVSTAFRNWKSFRHQYFEVTLWGCKSVTSISFNIAPFVFWVLRSKS